MRIFAIRDEETRPHRDLAYLFYFDRQKQFNIEIPDGMIPWDLPPILSEFAEKGEYTINDEWSRIWAEQRIIPPDRQNLGQILREDHLSEYDPFRMLIFSHGRCAQDGCYIAEIEENSLPREITARMKRRIDDIFPLAGGKMLVFFKNGETRFCDLEKLDVRGAESAASAAGKAVSACAGSSHRRLSAYYEKITGVSVLGGGYGIRIEAENGPADLEIDDCTLYQKGTSVPVSRNEFRESLTHNLVDTQEAAGLLGCTRQYISLLVREGRLLPVRQSEKSTIFLRSDLEKI